jgi:hypothetical protein
MRILRYGILLPLLCFPVIGASWDPISPAELTQSRPSGEEAPAEAIFRRIEVDDSDYPLKRVITEYSRYRIFDPEKAADLTRIALRSLAYNGDETEGKVVIVARLTSPQGASREFGNESIENRTVLSSGGHLSWLQRLFGETSVEIKEQFLAVPGVEAESILDLRTSRQELNLASRERLHLVNLQQPGVPTRSLDFTYHTALSTEWRVSPFILNGPPNHADTQWIQKEGILRLAARDVPALSEEPFTGPETNYALTFVAAYGLTRARAATVHRTDQIPLDPSNHGYSFDSKLEPWAIYATADYLVQEDRLQDSVGLRRFARNLAQGAPTELAKARLLHQYVMTQFLRFSALPRAKSRSREAFPSYPESELQLTDLEKNSDRQFFGFDFAFLETGLARAIGLEAQTLVLPNNQSIRFDRRLVAAAMLQRYAVRIRADGQWHFSYPTQPGGMPFEELPWSSEGQEALIVQPARQEFIPTPIRPSSQSQIENSGSFQLSAEGALSGSGTRTYTGHQAAERRLAILKLQPAEIADYFSARLRDDMPGATVTITGVQGADHPESPLAISFDLSWPDFSTATKNRLIFHPSLFHAGQPPPLTSTVRHYPFQFPYCWTESDRTVIAIPAGYELESKQIPGPLPGSGLSYESEIAQEQVSKKIHYSRTFVSNLLSAPAADNGALLRVYRAIADRDSFELVLRKPPGAAHPDQAAP